MRSEAEATRGYRRKIGARAGIQRIYDREEGFTDVVRGEASRGQCVLCGTIVLILKGAWKRSTRPMCACGGVLNRQTKQRDGYRRLPKPKRKCEGCGCLLRAGNKTALCAPCVRTMAVMGNPADVVKSLGGPPKGRRKR